MSVIYMDADIEYYLGWRCSIVSILVLW